MTKPRIDPALAAAFEGEFDAHNYRPDDAVGGGEASEVLRLVENANAINAKKLNKLVPILKRAVSRLRDGDPRGAGRLCVKAMNIDPDSAIAAHIAAIAMNELGAMRLAFELYERAIALDPTEPEVYHNLGLVAWSLDEFEIAEKFFRIFAAISPHIGSSANNLAGAVRDQGRFDEAIEILREAIGHAPHDPNLWNTLGTVLAAKADDLTALTFYNEALRLNPNLTRAYYNAGTVLHSLGQTDKAVTQLKTALAMQSAPSEQTVIKYALSHALLANGNLAEGWEAHEVRLDPKFKRAPFFDLPVKRWNNEPLEGKHVMLIGEQGLGDEVLFLSVARDFERALGPNGKLTIIVERRFVELMQRSFPNANVHRHITLAVNGRDVRGVYGMTDYAPYDCYVPMASVMGLLRPNLEAFENQEIGFLKPDPARVADFKARLDAAGPGPKVGFLWRSILMTARRLRFYAPLEAWRPALEACPGMLIPMQYGECAEDIAKMREWGLPILTFDDLDMKDDLDGVAALAAALDLCVGPPNCTTNIAGGVGTQVWILGEVASWTRLGTDKLPWYPRSRFFAADPSQGWAPAIDSLRTELAKFS